VEFPDIEPLCRARGVPPTKLKSDGTPFYTMPAIYDPERNQYVSESATIMRYLDARFGELGQPAFPKGTVGLQRAFLSAFVPKLVPLWPCAIPMVASQLNPRSLEYFKNTRSLTFGKTVEEFAEDVKLREESWEKFKAGMGGVARWLGDVKEYPDVGAELTEGDFGETGGFIMGDKPVFADFVIGATLAYIRALWGEDSEKWKEVMEWHGGRWAKFADSLRKYEQVV
jgi:glutathione S-transferase